MQVARTPFSMHGLPGRDAGTRRSEQPSAAAGSLPGAGRAAPFLSVLQHRPGLLDVLGTHDDLCGHGAYGVNGRHIFVADHRPDPCAVEHGFRDLGFCDGVVFRQYNHGFVLHNLSVFVGYLKLGILLIKCKSPATNSAEISLSLLCDKFEELRPCLNSSICTYIPNIRSSTAPRPSSRSSNAPKHWG